MDGWTDRELNLGPLYWMMCSGPFTFLIFCFFYLFGTRFHYAAWTHRDPLVIGSPALRLQVCVTMPSLGVGIVHPKFCHIKSRSLPETTELSPQSFLIVETILHSPPCAQTSDPSAPAS